MLIACKVIKTIRRENYEQFSNNLVAAERGRLNHNNSLFIVIKYLTSYQCKERESSKAYNNAVKVLTYVSVLNNQTILSLLLNSFNIDNHY